MPEYIERSSAAAYFENSKKVMWHKDDVVAAISSPAIPTADVAEVVRCKDCKRWLKDVAGCTDILGRCEWANYMVGADGYCVYGERKDGADDDR